MYNGHMATTVTIFWICFQWGNLVIHHGYIWQTIYQNNFSLSFFSYSEMIGDIFHFSIAKTGIENAFTCFHQYSVIPLFSLVQDARNGVTMSHYWNNSWAHTMVFDVLNIVAPLLWQYPDILHYKWYHLKFLEIFLMVKFLLITINISVICLWPVPLFWLSITTDFC